MDPGVGAGRAREEGGGQRQRRVAVWPCGRVGAAGCCCGGGTHQQASQAPGHQQQDTWGTLLIGCNPKMGLRTFPNVRLAGTLPQEGQEADHRWDPPRLRIRLARLLPCSSSPSLDCLPRTCSSAPPMARALPRRDRQIHPGPACGTIAPELRSGHGGLLACCETRPPPPRLLLLWFWSPPLLPGWEQCTLYIAVPRWSLVQSISADQRHRFSARQTPCLFKQTEHCKPFPDR